MTGLKLADIMRLNMSPNKIRIHMQSFFSYIVLPALSFIFFSFFFAAGDSAAQSGWNSFLKDPSHSAKTSETISLPLNNMWRFEAGDSIYSSPVVADGRICFGSNDEHVYCLAAESGRLIWKFKKG